jgi:large exoprotein involved in heme utilization and adhesion
MYTTVFSEVGGDGGSISIDAPQARVVIADGAVLQTGTVGEGNAGFITIQAGELDILNEGTIWSFTQGSGVGGNVSVAVTDSIFMDNGEIDSGTTGVGNGGQIILTSGELVVINDSEILADTLSTGAAGDVGIKVSGSASLDNSSAIGAATRDIGPAGQVAIRAHDLRLLGGSAVIASTGGNGTGGNVIIDVDGTLLLDDASFISSGVFGEGSGTGGGIHIKATSLEILNGGLIANNTIGGGEAGRIVVEATDVLIDGAGTLTGIIGDVVVGSGTAGDVRVTALGRLELSNGGLISSNVRDEGTAGAVTVEASELVIKGGRERADVTGIFSESRLSSGTGGDVQVAVKGRLEISSGGQISTGTQRGAGGAGRITVEATELVINGEGLRRPTGILSRSEDSSGAGGDVRVTARERLEILDGGQISASTQLGTGDAGTVTVQSSYLTIDGQGSGIFSDTVGTASEDASGIGGRVQVTASERLELRNAGQIGTSSRFSGGNAGAVVVEAAKLVINGGNTGIFSEATAGSFGQVGSVRIKAQDLWISDQGQIGIASAAMLADEELAHMQAYQIEITATNIQLTEGAAITGESTGNVPAGLIDIDAHHMLIEGDSGITTESNLADGGPIRIDGNQLWLRNSVITTSVLGASGDGGDIDLNPQFLILEGGFVQANTAAADASGGDITIDASALIASQGVVEIGGTETLEFQPGSGLNVIQAAAPGGEQGLIRISAPELDISGTLTTLSTPFIDPAQLITDECRIADGKDASALIRRDRGGIPLGSEARSTVSFGGDRLDRLLSQ